MALWRIKRLEVGQDPDSAFNYLFQIIMHDDSANIDEATAVALSKPAYIADNTILLAALVTAGYTPNDWGGV
jgi:hypothetical protein